MQKKVLDLMCNVAMEEKQVSSRSEFFRLYRQGALKINLDNKWVDLQTITLDSLDEPNFK